MFTAILNVENLTETIFLEVIVIYAKVCKMIHISHRLMDDLKARYQTQVSTPFIADKEEV